MIKSTWYAAEEKQVLDISWAGELNDGKSKHMAKKKKKKTLVTEH